MHVLPKSCRCVWLKSEENLFVGQFYKKEKRKTEQIICETLNI